MEIFENVVNEVFNDIDKKNKDYELYKQGWKPINEAGLNRIMTHGKHGFIIISSQRSSLETWDKNPELSLTSEYEKWCQNKGIEASENTVAEFLQIRNKNAEKELNIDIKRSDYAYSPVYGGYHYKGASDNSNDDYELSYIVYNHKKNENDNYGDFQLLFNKAIEWCQMFKQESVYIQAPDEAPHYYNGNNEICDTHSSKNFKFNDNKAEYFTINVSRKPTVSIVGGIETH